MTGQTPLQKLDDAVHEYFRDIGCDGSLAGRVLAYQAAAIEDNGPDIDPVQWDASYSISPGLSPFAALGLTDYVRTTIKGVFQYVHDDDEDDA